MVRRGPKGYSSTGFGVDDIPLNSGRIPIEDNILPPSRISSHADSIQARYLRPSHLVSSKANPRIWTTNPWKEVGPDQARRGTLVQIIWAKGSQFEDVVKFPSHLAGLPVCLESEVRPALLLVDYQEENLSLDSQPKMEIGKSLKVS